jgi:hypothetical protein
LGKKVTTAEELFNKGIELFNDGNYYDAMTNFTKSYNESGNTRSLFYSAEATFQFAKVYLKDNCLSGWEDFSKSALSKFELCVQYTTSSEIRQKATERINLIEELTKKVDELVGNK